MNTKKDPVDICGNCKHGIEVNEVGCTHLRNSFLCLETCCNCLDPSGRDFPEVGARHPFNKVRNQDCLQGLVTI